VGWIKRRHKAPTRKKKSQFMETLIRFLDNVEDAIVVAAWRIRRFLTRRPRERRRVPRTHMVTPEKPQPEDGHKGQA